MVATTAKNDDESTISEEAEELIPLLKGLGVSSTASRTIKCIKKMQLYLAIWEGQNSILYSNSALYRSP